MQHFCIFTYKLYTNIYFISLELKFKLKSKYLRRESGQPVFFILGKEVANYLSVKCTEVFNDPPLFFFANYLDKMSHKVLLVNSSHSCSKIQQTVNRG